jgi:hypothetical protein
MKPKDEEKVEEERKRVEKRGKKPYRAPELTKFAPIKETLAISTASDFS